MAVPPGDAGADGPPGYTGLPSARTVAAVLLGFAVAVAAAVFLGRHIVLEPPVSLDASGVGLKPVDFAAMDGWAQDDHAAALAALRRSCHDGAGDPGTPLYRACHRIDLLPAEPGAEAARSFFETNFMPFLIEPANEPDGRGLLTAYYEPVVPGALERTERFSTPLYALPANHTVVTDSNRPEGFDATLVAGRQTASAFEAYPTRGEIEAGAMKEDLEPLVWLENPVEAFFVHIQGSTRVRLQDGRMIRIGYAGKNGHPYSSIGRHMREAGIEPPGGLGMRGIRDYLLAHPDEAREIMAVNRSFIFFRIVDDLPPELGPIGAEGIPLTPKRSLAVDADHHEWGLPIFIEADLGTLGPFRHLTIAQDTGSALEGPARGDLFWGTGDEAGEAAGEVQARARFIALLPR